MPFLAALTPAVAGAVIHEVDLDFDDQFPSMVPTETGFSLVFSPQNPISFGITLHVIATEGTGWSLSITDQTTKQVRTIEDTLKGTSGPQLTGTTGVRGRSDVDAIVQPPN